MGKIAPCNQKVGGGARQFLHRLVDATIFRVQPEPIRNRAGVVDFEIQPSVRRLEPREQPR